MPAMPHSKIQLNKRYSREQRKVSSPFFCPRRVPALIFLTLGENTTTCLRKVFNSVDWDFRVWTSFLSPYHPYVELSSTDITWLSRAWWMPIQDTSRWWSRLRKTQEIRRREEVEDVQCHHRLQDMCHHHDQNHQFHRDLRLLRFLQRWTVSSQNH